MMRVLIVGKASLNRAFQRGELRSVPHVLTIPVGQSTPMGRRLDVPELRRIYAHAVPHIQAFMIWALGIGARPEAVTDLHSQQIDFRYPPEREQPKKYRPVVRLPDALWEEFVGWAVSYNGEPVKSIKKGLWEGL
jgi:hypothetical protein